MNIQKSNIKDIVELNMLQQGILYNTLNDENESLYNVQIAIEIKGEFDLTIFLQALKEVQRTNDALRSIFNWELTSKTLQIVLKEAEINVNQYDFSDDENQVEDFLIKDRAQKIDPNKGVPIRISLLKCALDTYILVITHHHILYDGWSTGILLKELFSFYNEFKEHSGRLEKKHFKSDYKEFIKKIAENQDSNGVAGYWLDYLEGFEPKVLPIQEVEDSVHRLEIQKFQIPIEDLKVFAQNEKVTMTSVIYLAYGLLLQYYKNSDDVVFATPVSNRDPFVPGSEEVIGNFMNTLPLRVSGIKKASLRDAIKKIDSEVRIRNEFSHSSYYEIKKIKQLKSSEDLFDSLLAVENYPLDLKAINGNKEFTLNLRSSSEQIEIPLLIQVFLKDTLEIVFQYNTTHFSDAFISTFSTCFKNVLIQSFNSPNLGVSDVDFLTRSEKDSIQAYSKGKISAYPKNLTVLDLINKRVQLQPTDTALIYEGKRLVYEDLNKQSDALARFLVTQGILPNTLVPICLDRSIEMVVGILGVLKAGCAYVPIDPAYPTRRISYILEDTQAKLMLTQEKYVEELLALKGVKIVPLDNEIPYMNTSETLLPGITPDVLIYVIYTSGTTGNPKGVMNEHGGVVNRLLWMEEYLEMSDEDVILQKTTFCFDVSVWEIFLPLITGCQMVLAVSGGEKESKYLQELIQNEQITIMHFVPSMLSAFLWDVDPFSCSKLKHVICSGEELKATQVKDFRSKLPSAKLHNLYGPTEASIDVTAVEVNTYAKGIVPIGRPIANTQIFIVDHYKRLRPVGLPGELLIGGIQIARGYLNGDALTSEKFIASPFTEGERLYRTGDLAKWLPDGNIAYLGRG
ncbi:MAG: amino acid adenylation domain-containing protein, partial [Bacteroidota bacterium]